MDLDFEIGHYPLDLNQVPASWKVVPIKDVVQDIEPGFPSGEQTSKSQGIPHLRPMNIDMHGRLDLNDVRYVNNQNATMLERGDVLFNNTNSPKWVGKTTQITSDAELTFSNHMTCLRAADGIVPDFLAKQLHFLCRSGYFQHQAKNHVNQSSISSNFLANKVPFLLAPTCEQVRIVSKINALHDQSARIRSMLERLTSQLEQLHTFVLSVAFEGDLTEEWRRDVVGNYSGADLLDQIRIARKKHWEESELTRFELKNDRPPDGWQFRFEDPAPVDESSLPALPSRWAWGASEEIVEPGAEIVYGILQPGQNITNGVPYVRGKDIQDGIIQVSQLFRTSEEIAKRYERSALREGDILLGIILSWFSVNWNFGIVG